MKIPPPLPDPTVDDVTNAAALQFWGRYKARPWLRSVRPGHGSPRFLAIVATCFDPELNYLRKTGWSGLRLVVFVAV